MDLEKRVLEAQINPKACDKLISEYNNFIASCANKATGKYITEHDDEMSVALIAFSESIKRYESGKGNFLNFAAMTIKSRLIDYMRKEYRTAVTMPFSSLARSDKDGNEMEFDIEDNGVEENDMRYEIESLTEELKNHNISFLELAKVSPKSKKTKLACNKVIKFVLNQPILVSELKKNDTLPIKVILENININRKVVERHRKYIITGLIVLTGNYEGIAEYFKGAKEVML